MSQPLFGAIELGGTKILCGVGQQPQTFLDTRRLDTGEAEHNLTEIIDYFRTCAAQYGPIAGLGVASFGPLDIDPQSQHYGRFLQTPKPGWSGFPLRHQLQAALSLPVAVTTDVNGALLAEAEFGAAQAVAHAVYVTVGTGVGGGIMVNRQLLRGFMHPELGHMRVPTYGLEGSCPFHGNCLEGLVCGPAIAKRVGRQAQQLGADHPAWEQAAANLGDMCVNLLTILAPQKIILGGGVMQAPGLLEHVRRTTAHQLAGYLPIDEYTGGIDQLIVPPALGSHSGLIGARLHAQREFG